MLKSTGLIPLKIKRYDNFFLRLRGLTFKKQPLSGQEGVLIVPCNSIHMFFMFFPIDAIFLNKQNEIVFVAEQVQRGKIVKPVKGAYAVLEVQSGFAKKHGLKKGMFLAWQEGGIKVKKQLC